MCLKTAGQVQTMHMAFELPTRRMSAFIGTPHATLHFTPKMWENRTGKNLSLPDHGCLEKFPVSWEKSGS